jgi:hypothetical protein
MKYWKNQDKELNKLAWNRNDQDFGRAVTPGAKRYQKWLNKGARHDNRWIGIPEPELRKPERHHWRRHNKPYSVQQNNGKAMSMIYIMLAIIVMLVISFLLFFVATRK